MRGLCDHCFSEARTRLSPLMFSRKWIKSECSLGTPSRRGEDSHERTSLSSSFKCLSSGSTLRRIQSVEASMSENSDLSTKRVLRNSGHAFLYTRSTTRLPLAPL